MSIASLLFAQATWAAKYECGVMESKYQGANILADSSRQETQCGSAVIDTEGNSSAYFSCGGGMSLSIYQTGMSFTLTNRENTSKTEGTYIQLAKLKAGTDANWQRRAPLHSAVLEAKEGIPGDLVLLLSLDQGGVVRERSVGYYAVCSKL